MADRTLSSRNGNGRISDREQISRDWLIQEQRGKWWTVSFLLPLVQLTIHCQDLIEIKRRSLWVPAQY